MKQEKIDRINFLARKAKETGLEPHEIEEQQVLRREYIDSYKNNLKAQLDNIIVVENDGTKHKLQKKK